MTADIIMQINIALAALLAIFAGVYVSLRFRNFNPSDHKEQIRKKVESFRDSMVYKMGTQQFKEMISRQFMPPIITRL